MPVWEPPDHREPPPVIGEGKTRIKQGVPTLGRYAFQTKCQNIISAGLYTDTICLVPRVVVLYFQV